MAMTAAMSPSRRPRSPTSSVARDHRARPLVAAHDQLTTAAQDLHEATGQCLELEGSGAGLVGRGGSVLLHARQHLRLASMVSSRREDEEAPPHLLQRQ